MRSSVTLALFATTVLGACASFTVHDDPPVGQVVSAAQLSARFLTASGGGSEEESRSYYRRILGGESRPTRSISRRGRPGLSEQNPRPAPFIEMRMNSVFGAT